MKTVLRAPWASLARVSLPSLLVAWRCCKGRCNTWHEVCLSTRVLLLDTQPLSLRRRLVVCPLHIQLYHILSAFQEKGGKTRAPHMKRKRWLGLPFLGDQVGTPAKKYSCRGPLIATLPKRIDPTQERLLARQHVSPCHWDQTPDHPSSTSKHAPSHGTHVSASQRPSGLRPRH